MDYYVVSQGKTTIPGVDDAEELGLTDVRINWQRRTILYFFLILILLRTHFAFKCTLPIQRNFPPK